ncbi:TonB-dependent receptor [Niabella defluvii]|nr:TonB-dependent receptor [Niabella sp. I65]
MTIGASGVKVYEQLKYAAILNTSLDVGYQITKKLLWTGQLAYRRGTGENGLLLPLMQPFTYNSVVTFSQKSFFANASINGSSSHTRYNPEFGEKVLPAYAVFNLSLANRFKFNDAQVLTLKTGVENLLDRNYTTFADWNRIPRIGRNFL